MSTETFWYAGTNHVTEVQGEVHDDINQIFVPSSFGYFTLGEHVFRTKKEAVKKTLKNIEYEMRVLSREMDRLYDLSSDLYEEL